MCSFIFYGRPSMKHIEHACTCFFQMIFKQCSQDKIAQQSLFSIDERLSEFIKMGLRISTVFPIKNMEIRFTSPDWEIRKYDWNPTEITPYTIRSITPQYEVTPLRSLWVD